MRIGLVGIAASAALTLALGAGSAQAATSLGVEWSKTCGKASCFDDKGVFTQTFAAGSFNGPVDVGQLLLERTVLGALDGETFRISFRLNDEELGSWGKYNMSGIAGDALSFTGANFTWNPGDGDLVLVLEIVQPEKGGLGGGLFGARGAPSEESQEQPTQGGPSEGGPSEGGPSETPPQGRPVGPIPEPSTWAMMITGFGFAGAMARRRRTVLHAQL